MDEDARRVFAGIDADNSGDITYHEMKSFMRRENPFITDEEVQKHYDRMDVNRDGRVSKKEFQQPVLPQPPVDLKGWHMKAIVKKLQSTSWEDVLMVGFAVTDYLTLRMYGWSLLACLDIVDSVFVRWQVITPDVLAFGPIEGTLAQ